MDYLRTDTDLASDRVTLLIFMPDASESHLVGSIEQWLRSRAACVPIARHWFSYTDEALRRFYPGVTDTAPSAGWQLISSVFSAGPCLATLWFGEHAPQAIRSVKGETHPAHCSGATLRGRFWCDNPIANLVHASDDSADLARELGVLRSLEPELFVGPLSTQALSPFRDPAVPRPRHSAILTLASLVATLLSTQPSTRGRVIPALELPEGGEARETMTRAEAWLRQAGTSTPQAVAEAVESYLNGTADPVRFLRALNEAVAVDPWEELILRCGLLSRQQWLEAR